MIENGLKLKGKKARRRRYPAETSVEAIYADGPVLLSNIPVNAKCFLYKLEQAAKDINLNVKSDKTYIFTQDGAMSTLNKKVFKVSRSFQIVWSQYQIWKWCQITNKKIMNCYQQVIDDIQIWYL